MSKPTSEHIGGPISSHPSFRNKTEPAIILSLASHTITEIYRVITVANNAHSDASAHLHHHNIPVKPIGLNIHKSNMNSINNDHMSLRVIYHHLLISARSPLITRDRSLSLTMGNTIHTLTPHWSRRPTDDATQHSPIPQPI